MRRSLELRLAGYGLAALLLSAPAGSQSTSGDDQEAPPAPEIVQLKEEAASRLTVPIRIGGRGPYNFVIDTGSERTVISDTLARSLALDPGRPVRLHSMSGVAHVETAMIPELQVSRRSIMDVNAPILRAHHIGAAGILGIDALKSQRVDFDFSKQTMKVALSQGAPSRFLDGAIVVTAQRRAGRLIMTDARLDGERVTVVVDTGSSVTIGNDALRRRLEAKGKLKTTTPIELISVTGGKILADQSVLRRMRLGAVTLEDMPVAFAQVHPFEQLKLNDRPALILGMDVLTLFRGVSVDFAQRKVHFLMPDLSMRSNLRLAERHRSGPVG